MPSIIKGCKKATATLCCGDMASGSLRSQEASFCHQGSFGGRGSMASVPSSHWLTPTAVIKVCLIKCIGHRFQSCCAAADSGPPYVLAAEDLGCPLRAPRHARRASPHADSGTAWCVALVLYSLPLSNIPADILEVCIPCAIRTEARMWQSLNLSCGDCKQPKICTHQIKLLLTPSHNYHTDSNEIRSLFI